MKPKIGIIQGDTNGVGYELILKAFEDPTFNELCTPIVYGSKNAAMQTRKAMEIQTNFSTIKDTEDATDNRLNILDCLEGEITVDFGKETAESMQAASICLKKAMEDEELDAIVSAHSMQALPCPENAMQLLLTNNIRMAIVKNITIEEMQAMHKVLERDFGCRDPRIAIVSDEAEDVSDLIKETEQNRICTYGTYKAEEFFEKRMFLRFDGIVTTSQKAIEEWQKDAFEYGVRYYSGEDIMAMPYHDAKLKIAGKGIADPASLCHSIYTTIDVMRNRTAYDEARVSPLPKLFHDRRDERRNNNIE